jgi:hypothetical protein
MRLKAAFEERRRQQGGRRRPQDSGSLETQMRCYYFFLLIYALLIFIYKYYGKKSEDIRNLFTNATRMAGSHLTHQRISHRFWQSTRGLVSRCLAAATIVKIVTIDNVDDKSINLKLMESRSTRGPSISLVCKS